MRRISLHFGFVSSSFVGLFGFLADDFQDVKTIYNLNPEFSEANECHKTAMAEKKSCRQGRQYTHLRN
jgi:hypothetical protein